MNTRLAVFGAALALITVNAGAANAGPTDPQIADIVVVANQVDIDAGKLAQSRAQSDEVKAFAERMVTDHSGVNKSPVDLVTKLHVTPEPNDRKGFAEGRRCQPGGAVA